jgi:ABC-2 type transport system ATP-binding protein
MATSQPLLAVEARGLVKHFGEVRALDGVDIEVPTGSVLGLLGPNGAGKTTAVRILSTILPPDRGSARVLGHDVVHDADRVRASIGLAGQFAAVDGNLTGRENLVLIGRLAHLPRAGIRSRADELLERFGLADAAGRTVRTYSGGMRRRLDLAAALLHRPPVLFLDEPTTGLDPASRSGLWSTVRDLVAEGTTVLLTTQYLEEADLLADRIVVIDRGTAIAEGTPAQLKARLGATVIELTFPGEAEARAAEDAVAGLDHRELSREEATVRLNALDAPAALVGVLRTLDARGIEIEGIAVREPSLDDVFLTLTGRRPAEEEEPLAAEPGEGAREEVRA